MQTKIFDTNFTWTAPKRIDDEFTIGATFNAEPGKFLEIYHRDAIPGIAKYGRVLHPEFKAFCKTSSNYVAISGKVFTIFKWEPEQDEFVDYLIANMETAPFSHKFIHTSIEIDKPTRTIFRNTDLGLIPDETWFQNNAEWGLDMILRFESVQNLSMVCLMSEKLYDWTDMLYKLPAGKSVTINKQTDKLNYICSFGADVTASTANATKTIANLDAIKMASDQITVTAGSEPATLLWRYRDVV